MQDALEVIDKSDATFLSHDLITPHLLKFNPESKTALKAVGSIVIPRKHVTKIQLDRKFQRLYDAETEPKLPKAQEESKQ